MSGSSLEREMKRRPRPEAPRHALNPALTGFSCIRCERSFEIGDYLSGCPVCLELGKPASVRSEFSAQISPQPNPAERGMMRFAHLMPYTSWVTLGEGATPCLSFPALAGQLGADRVLIKNEGQNPTGSHKDRMSCLAVTRARDIGAGRIVAASSGNGGASLALYAASAGLPCSIVATPALPPIQRRAVESAGAELVFVEDSLERWNLMANMVAEEASFPATNFLNPPVGSNHYGVDGLQTIAYELAEDLDGAGIDAVIVPTSRGDLLWGLAEGFRRLKELRVIDALPRLFAVEPFARISTVLGGRGLNALHPGTTRLTSIGGSTVTYQAVAALRATEGRAVVVNEREVFADQLLLARHGCYAELSSAAALTGLKSLLGDGTLARSDTVVLLVTSNGYKDAPDAGGSR